ncbi:MAG TPA: 6-phosphogluconolactonase [Candidatus Aquabacterium excrementipullorum]|nr:6-phosphogluconolactonase [Candidatus Aquabacterium excrementipullorum]
MDGNGGPVLHRAADAASLAVAVAQAVEAALREALAVRGRATLVVSGGSTPVPMWQRLSQSDLDWTLVTITLADERWVPVDDPASNESLVRRHLLRNEAAWARWVPLYNGMATPQEAQPTVEARLSTIAWPADVVVLGMGGDGHTASWFPGQVMDASWQAHCAAVDTPRAPNVPAPRMTLTPRTLLDARHMILHLTGADKEPVLARALTPGNTVELPVRRALHESRAVCHVYFAP